MSVAFCSICGDPVDWDGQGRRPTRHEERHAEDRKADERQKALRGDGPVTRRARTAAPDRTPDLSVAQLTFRCACEAEFPSAAQLFTHTYQEHGRGPTPSERAPSEDAA